MDRSRGLNPLKSTCLDAVNSRTNYLQRVTEKKRAWLRFSVPLHHHLDLSLALSLVLSLYLSLSLSRSSSLSLSCSLPLFIWISLSLSLYLSLFSAYTMMEFDMLVMRLSYCVLRHLRRRILVSNQTPHS